ncbi:hypothetical protein [Mesorhizobium sp.]|uniref:alpha/beta fold hydrolase n=1 Tax=Mesorhizobium sp. TaxID=1871066 RepID=UPI00257A5B94|nr:hypothetical protein [Mesorhizobium sp.]
MPHFAPGRVDDSRFAAWVGRFERLSASPTAAAALARMNAGIDGRGVLAAISAPTLLIHRRNDARVDPDASRFLAKKIANARLVEVARARPPDLDRRRGPRGGPDRGIPDRQARRGRGGACARCAFGDAHSRYGTARDRMWLQETWRLLVGRHDGRTAGTHGEMMMTRFDGPARAIRCAVALCDAAQGIRVASAQGVHVGEIESRGPPTGLTALVTMQFAARAARGNILAVNGEKGDYPCATITWRTAV